MALQPRRPQLETYVVVVVVVVAHASMYVFDHHGLCLADNVQSSGISIFLLMLIVKMITSRRDLQLNRGYEPCLGPSAPCIH